ncbi:two-component system, cell cycle sensor histidine kinase and response regulator CckA [Gammaproteobacteria bacterium]|nr:two-component system, cell cycle sensor histidine kinase and response regulator CckA [Gammaproteobacteria bacterium]
MDSSYSFEPHELSSGFGESLAPPDPALLESVLDAIPARVVVVDRELRYMYANAESLRFWGLPAERVIGMKVVDVVGEQRFAPYLPKLQRVWGGERLRWEGWAVYEQHGRRYIQEVVMPFTRSGGEVKAIIAFGRDLTEFKQQSDALAQKLTELERAEALKSAIVDHASAAIVSTDARGLIVEFNPAAVAMFGLPRDAALGRDIAGLLVVPDDGAAAPDAASRAGRDVPLCELGRRLEGHALRPDGHRFPIELVMWRTDVAATTYYTASINDMSERQRAAETIERQRDALRQSEKLSALGSLLAGVAHELNNPLAIVMGRAGLLQEKAAGTPVADDARRIHDAAERCARIVRTFLNMARQRPAVRAPVQVNDIARAAADMLGYTLRSHGVTLTLSLVPDLPLVQADGDQIGQVVLNLIVNAQQALAAHAGERRIEIATGVEQRRPEREPRVWLCVGDSGPGVPPALRATVFEPFFTTKGEGVGTGLGLSVSRAIVHQHGGDLVLQDGAPGAMFRMSLPLSGGAEVVPTVPGELPAADAPQARLLVVDDEPEIVELLRSILEGAGYEVASAESGEVALALLAEARFDAIVSDLRMPDIDGAGLWRAVREHHPSLARRIVFVTGDTLSPGARAFLDESRCASLEKPFAKPELVQAVQRALGGDAASS